MELKVLRMSVKRDKYLLIVKFRKGNRSFGSKENSGVFENY